MTEFGAPVTVVAALLIGLLAAPHALPLHRVAPRAAARAWMFALSARALVAVALVLATLIWLPSTEPFQLLAGDTWHRLVPAIPDDIDLSLDPLAHAAVLLPAVAMLISVSAFGFLLLRVTASTRRQMRSHGLGAGPQGSLVMADRGVYVALTGVGPKRVLVSAGALQAMDPAELRASLAHEDGHQRLSHRTWALIAGALRAIARLLPGTSACERGLRLSLERQADEYAVARTRDPLALASAICKAAGGSSPYGALAVSGSGSSVRLEQLLGSARTRSASPVERSVNVLATALLGATLLLAGALIALAGSQAGALGLAVACSF